MTPTQRSRRGQRLRTAQGGLASQVKQPAHKSAASALCLHPGDCQVSNHSFSHRYIEEQLHCCSQGAGGQHSQDRAPAAPQGLRYSRERAGKGQDMFSCSFLLSPTFPWPCQS